MMFGYASARLGQVNPNVAPHFEIPLTGPPNANFAMNEAVYIPIGEKLGRRNLHRSHSHRHSHSRSRSKSRKNRNNNRNKNNDPYYEPTTTDADDGFFETIGSAIDSIDLNPFNRRLEAVPSRRYGPDARNLAVGTFKIPGN